MTRTGPVFAVAQGHADPVAADDRPGTGAVPVKSAAARSGRRRAPPAPCKLHQLVRQALRHLGVAFAFSPGVPFCGWPRPGAGTGSAPALRPAQSAAPCSCDLPRSLGRDARRLGKRATIFVAARTRPHPRTLEAARLGAKVVPISPGYLSVVQSRAREYCRNTGASLIPFGTEIPGAVEAIAAAPRLAAFDPEEVWRAAGSGVLARGLAAARPKVRRHVVQIGRDLSPREVGGVTIHVHPRKFSDRAALAAPFPADPHYDAKAWELCVVKRGSGRVLFWNVAPLVRG